MKIEEWEEYRYFLSSIEDTVEHISESPVLRKVTGYIFNTTGKKLRPLVIMLSCGAAGGDFRDAVKASLAVEAIHTASLVHDDILDESDMRRSQKSVHAKFGETAAILCGDFLISNSIELISGYGAAVIKDFGHSGVLLCEGEAIDAGIKRGEMTTDQYLLCIYKKTAALFEISARIGSRVGAPDREDLVDAFGTFGRNLGMAYQIVDDLLEDFGLYKDKESGILSDSLYSITLRSMPEKEAAALTVQTAEKYLADAKEALSGIPASDSLEKLLFLADYISGLMDHVRKDISAL
ncbi:polyprenyl synthetase family protein [Methanosarcinaceae archaeon]|nr:polyprenyl synthetase family protein [Methanosarcinaceae archaeon]MBQ3620122.1 polyprenyl synthetase family protein [Methanosarcinaceae archaeon]